MTRLLETNYAENRVKSLKSNMKTIEIKLSTSQLLQLWMGKAKLVVDIPEARGVSKTKGGKSNRHDTITSLKSK